MDLDVLSSSSAFNWASKSFSGSTRSSSPPSDSSNAFRSARGGATQFLGAMKVHTHTAKRRTFQQRDLSSRLGRFIAIQILCGDGFPQLWQILVKGTSRFVIERACTRTRTRTHAQRLRGRQELAGKQGDGPRVESLGPSPNQRETPPAACLSSTT